jgi:hypothetical protein
VFADSLASELATITGGDPTSGFTATFTIGIPGRGLPRSSPPGATSARCGPPQRRAADPLSFLPIKTEGDHAR